MNKRVYVLMITAFFVVYSAQKHELNKQNIQATAHKDVQKIEQEIKEKERAYHNAVQEQVNAKKNNASPADIARLEQEEEKAKTAWQEEKKKLAQE